MHVPLMDSCYLLQHCPRPLRHPLHSYPPDKMRFRFLHHLPTSWSISCALSTPYSIHRPLQHHSLPAAPLSTWQHMVRIKTDIIDWLYDLFIDFGQHLPTVLMLSLQLLIIPWKYCPLWKKLQTILGHQAEAPCLVKRPRMQLQGDESMNTSVVW